MEPDQGQVRRVRSPGTRTRLLRPIVRAADGIAHNRERKRMIHRYRRVACVALVADGEERGADSRS